jgi:hypothetical protein
MDHDDGVPARWQLRENRARRATTCPDSRPDKAAAIRHEPTFSHIRDSALETSGIVVKRDQNLAAGRTHAIDRESQLRRKSRNCAGLMIMFTFAAAAQTSPTGPKLPTKKQSWADGFYSPIFLTKFGGATDGSPSWTVPGYGPCWACPPGSECPQWPSLKVSTLMSNDFKPESRARQS